MLRFVHKCKEGWKKNNLDKPTSVQGKIKSHCIQGCEAKFSLKRLLSFTAKNSSSALQSFKEFVVTLLQKQPIKQQT